MNNPFKRIRHYYSVPKELKEKIISDISMIKLTLDIADFFLVKFPNPVCDLFIGSKNGNKEH